MFFYISFLRCPPSHTTLSEKLLITPQIANDLRTELFDNAQDIFFYWSQSIPKCSAGISELSTPKPSKLTTWRPRNAYKEIAVPLPPGIRDGQSWSLVLTADVAQDSHFIDLKGNAIGATPFPVISMPVLFTQHRKIERQKQEHIQRVYRVPLPDGEPTYLTIREQTSFDLDKKIWDSGVGLSSWLIDLRDDSPELTTQPGILTALKDALFALGECKILELGTGTGIVSLTLATLRSSLSPPGNGDHCILATDLPSAMPLLEHNITTNDHLFPSTSARPQAIVLDWDAELPDSIQTTPGGFNVLIMADVAYNTSSFPALIRTLSNLIRLQTNNAKPPLLLLGYKERDPSERVLWDMAKGIGVVFEKVGERKGGGCAAVEVWVGKVEDLSDL